MSRKHVSTRPHLRVEALEQRSCPSGPGASTSLFGFGWADRAGSSTDQGYDQGLAIATDRAGDVYVTGRFMGAADFGPGPGATTLISAGDTDIFVAKYSSAGAVLWAKDMGGASSDDGRSLVVDGSGNVYVTGDFYQSAVFGAGEANQATLTATGYNVFVARLASSSGNLAWVRQYGGSAAFNYGNGLALDRGGSLYLTGVFSGDAAFGTATLSSVPEIVPQNGSHMKDGESFVINDGTRSLTFEYDSNGHVAAGNTRIAFKTTDSYYAVTDATVKAINNANAAGMTGAIASYRDLAAYVTRATAVTYTPIDPTAPSLTIVRAEGAFLAKLRGTDGGSVWAKNLSGPNVDDEAGSSVAVNDGGVSVASGTQHSPATRYIWRFNLDGSGPVWVDQLAGVVQAITLDPSGNVLATGSFGGTVDFDPGPGTTNLTSTPKGSDVFVLKLDGTGTFLWARAWGGSGTNVRDGVVTDGSGNVYITGAFSGNVGKLISQGDLDAFVQKLDSAGNILWNAAMGAAKTDMGLGIAVDGAGGVYTTGFFTGKGDFDPTSNKYTLKSAGITDIFVAKLTQPAGSDLALTLAATSTAVASPSISPESPAAAIGSGLTATRRSLTRPSPRSVSFIRPGGDRVAGRVAIQTGRAVNQGTDTDEPMGIRRRPDV